MIIKKTISISIDIKNKPEIITAEKGSIIGFIISKIPFLKNLAHNQIDGKIELAVKDSLNSTLPGQLKSEIIERLNSHRIVADVNVGIDEV